MSFDCLATGIKEQLHVRDGVTALFFITNSFLTHFLSLKLTLHIRRLIDVQSHRNDLKIQTQ